MFETAVPVRNTLKDFFESERDRLKWLASGGGGTGGMGLILDSDPPFKSSVVPGGLLDCSGRHIPIIDIDAPKQADVGLKLVALETFGFFIKRFEYRYSFGKPEQLTLEEFKSRLIKLCYQEKGFPRPIKSINAANSFREIMEVEFGKERVDRFYKTEKIKNWIDEAK
ncbi:hypothetical protein [Pseudaestuariivita rosea]|uniref:hypothetical protein n=1 Tax=Pseudaestuariivita rosea TaxID=2763263 RepID=UPI001ABB2A1A|nr:hypothetical protein [Pseudaestuariivita rosea]